MARIFLARATSELGGERLIVIKEILPLFAASSESARRYSFGKTFTKRAR